MASRLKDGVLHWQHFWEQQCRSDYRGKALMEFFVHCNSTTVRKVKTENAMGPYLNMILLCMRHCSKLAMASGLPSVLRKTFRALVASAPVMATGGATIGAELPWSPDLPWDTHPTAATTPRGCCHWRKPCTQPHAMHAV